MVFRFNIYNGLSSLDPAFGAVQSNLWLDNLLFNGLVQLNEKLEILPCIAKSWEISADGKTYTFHLRKTIFFHDNELFVNGKGRKVIASDFVYTFHRIIDPTVASKGSWIFNGKVTDKNPFVALDDSTFEIHLKNPYAPIMGILTMPYCKVVPKEVVEHYGKDFRSHPVGTGPFKFKYWRENDALLLLKNENYFEKDSLGKQLPYLDAVYITFVENKSTEFLKFRQGELDFISDVDPSFKDDVLTKRGELQPRYNGLMVLDKSVYLNSEYIGCNLIHDPKNNPLTFLKVRQAIAYGIDRKKLITFMRNNIGLPAEHGFVTPGLSYFNADSVKGYSYQPELARKLLEEAGFPNGKNFPEISLLCSPSSEGICNFVVAQLKDIGINIKVESMEGRAIAEMKVKGTADFFRGSWVADYPDAETFLAVFYSKYGAPPNYTRFNNKIYDDMYEKAISTSDNVERNKIYMQMDQLMITEAPVIPLYYDVVLRILQPHVKGLLNNPLNLLDLKTTYFKDTK
ncbi:peptide ABC transporter substrate-binding protein [Bacteroidota bacterium]|nr:peptide ABC transporter substrate-binding protein [Bacteroidota bacterium]